jgi:hypothetical protein
MSITTIARQAQGMRSGEVIAKLTEDAYFMRVDNRVAQVPPLRTREPTTMKPQVVVQQTTDATVPEENCPRTPTVPGLQLAGLLRVVTVPVAPTVVAALPTMVMLAAEAAAAGAPHTGPAGELVAEAIAEAEATQAATSLVPHAAATMLAAELKKFDARSPPWQAKMTASPLLCSTSQSAPPREIQASGDHQVRREARPSPMAQMLRPLHRKCWRQQ